MLSATPKPTSFYYYNHANVRTETIRSIVERSSRLQHLVLKEYIGSRKILLQFLLNNCPDLKTIDLSGNTYHYNPHLNTSSPASWTQCTRLKELGLYRFGGSKMTDPRWNISSTPFLVSEPSKN
ncbi:hypothetical protein BG015_003583 [Linnemannia schmuckeri]|uniref:Uncharacterized protein n=1 Tax=Linnemannia schmuckeri TaxID=64567 RepID=A0A9P5S6U1_9FUNG|nr:hypothetical protein BG015_003583 [Linnemannia schmuckeri]